MFSSAVSSSWAWSSGPVTRTSGSCGKTTVPSGMASTSHCKPHLGQVVEKRRLEQRLLVVAAQAGQVGEVFRVEAQVLQVLDDRGQAGGDREAAAERVLAEEQVKHGLLVVAARSSSSRRPS